MTRKIAFFEGWSWLKFNNLVLALGTYLKCCTSVAKGLKLKVRKFWGPNPAFVELTKEKLVGGGLFTPLPPSWIGSMHSTTLYPVLRTYPALSETTCIKFKCLDKILHSNSICRYQRLCNSSNVNSKISIYASVTEIDPC